jgi:transcription elongation factor GreA
MQEEEKIYLTPEGKQKLQDELKELEGPKRQEMAQRLKAAIEMGDLSENADYITAKEEQGFLEGKIQEIKHILHHAILVESGSNGKNSVQVGSTVTVEVEGEGEQETYYLVGSKEADPVLNKISHASPIGKALLDREKGEQIEVKTPGGKLVLKILAIE